MASHSITKLKLAHSKVLAVARGSSLRFFNSETGAPIATTGDQHTAIIRGISFNASGRVLVSVSDDKQVKLWSGSDAGWKNISTTKVPKKMTAGQIAPNDKTVIVSDKLGDVLHFPVTFSADFSEATVSEQPQVIVGHYSSISVMTMSTDGKYVITGDKDEHVRVSHYPHGFDIESFCLGHTEFIAGLVVSHKHPELLVSGGGDGTVKLWHMPSGKLLDTTFVGDNQGKKSEDADTVIPLDIYEPTQSIIVGLEEKPVVYFFNIVGDKLVAKGSLDLTAPVGSASFDTQGNAWVSYLPIDKLHQKITALENQSTTTSTATPASEVTLPAPTDSKLAVLTLTGDKYTVAESSSAAAINKQFTDTVEPREVFGSLHELSKNFQFRKRFGDGEFAQNISNNYFGANANNEGAKGNKKNNKKDNKKAKLEKNEATNEPVLPNFVANKE